MENSNKRQRISHDCPQCDKSFKNKTKLDEHYRSHTGERPLKCDYPDCGKAFRKSSHLHIHLKRHQNLKDHKCSFKDCKAAFLTKQHLVRHEKAHETPLIQCDFPDCTHTFTKRNQLRRHKATHVNEIHQCECGNEFTTLSAFEKHRNRVHENPIIYKCSTCHNEFKKWSELRKHVANDHPNICGFCQKTFSKQHNLSQHIKDIHTDMKYPCDWTGCDAVLSTKRSYTSHVALVHKQGTQHKCDICDKGFPYKSVLKRHKLSHERKPKEPSKKKLTVAEQVSGFNHYNKSYTIECSFKDCPYKFRNEYLLRRHLEGKRHAEDIKTFTNNHSTIDA